MPEGLRRLRGLPVTKVFVVSQGDYSAYEVDSIFTDRERAERRRRFIGGNEIEEFALDPEPESVAEHEGWGWYRVRITKGGDIKWISLDPHWRRRRFHVVSRGSFLTPVGPEDLGVTADAYIRAVGDQHAAKIANEIRARVVALDLWRIGDVDIDGIDDPAP